MVKGLGEQELKLPKRPEKKKRKPPVRQTKKTKSKKAFYLIIPFIILSIGMHFYLMPSFFVERLISALVMLSLIVAGLYVSYIVFFNLRK